MSGREHLKDCGLSTPSADDISVTIMFSYPNVHFFLIVFLLFQVMIWAHLQLRLQTSLRGCLSSQGKSLCM